MTDATYWERQGERGGPRFAQLKQLRLKLNKDP